jgi:hypothetical protein
MSGMSELVLAVLEDLDSGVYTPEEIAEKWGIPLGWVLVLVSEKTE